MKTQIRLAGVSADVRVPRTQRPRGLEAKAESFNDSYRKYPTRMDRHCVVEGNKLVGKLGYPCVYQPLKCGCTVTGNGTLQFPLTVVHCKKHNK